MFGLVLETSMKARGNSLLKNTRNRAVNYYWCCTYALQGLSNHNRGVSGVLRALVNGAVHASCSGCRPHDCSAVPYGLPGCRETDLGGPDHGYTLCHVMTRGSWFLRRNGCLVICGGKKHVIAATVIAATATASVTYALSARIRVHCSS